MSRPSLLRVTQLWFLLLIVGSFQPVRPGPVHALHRELHWFVFAVAAFLVFALARSRRQAIGGAVAVCALGLFLELCQHLLYRNSMEWWDVRDDAFAVLAAFALYRFTLARKAPSQDHDRDPNLRPASARTIESES